MIEGGRQIVDLRWPSAFGIFGLGFLVGEIVCVFHYAKVHLVTGAIPEATMNYADLVTIILTALGVMFALVSIILAVVAVWGYKGLKDEIAKNAAKIAAESADKEVKRQLSEDGELRKYLKDTVERLVYPDFDAVQSKEPDC